MVAGHAETYTFWKNKLQEISKGVDEWLVSTCNLPPSKLLC